MKGFCSENFGRSKRPVCLVGNKVDMVPLDGKGSLDRMKTALIESATVAGLNKVNLKHVVLVSSKTGFGIEELITKRWNSWKNKGDIYILGCTNVGKSSLFNALLQSDLCKSDAVDLIDRATTSIWPGTTLNLLKERTQRLIEERNKKNLETQLQKEQVKKTQNPVYASLMGKIGRTFLSKQELKKMKEGENDPFSVSSNTIPSTGDPRPIYDPNDPRENRPKFCLDSPGTVNNDQLLSLLTMKELELVVPREYIRPRSFLIRPRMTLLLADLGQIDFIDENNYIYECENTPLIAVPTGGQERKNIQFKEFEMKGMWWDESYADITLSSAGWIAVTLGARKEAKIRVGTPNAQGIYMRKPSLLPKAVNLRGKKIRASSAYRDHKVVFSH
ncbi:hypothetical protein QYM36_005694 [Artemia franciscana]|uniref:G domain-containing protein n=1 Tax=Artemia franciscana TaxID=6661 RepID=A0AA88IC35_ARTSF|nr:hypothetical protein QYM36_005694 [Artemia franciscana]